MALLKKVAWSGVMVPGMPKAGSEQRGLRPTSCINQGKVVETKFYLELSGFLYKMSSKINVSWWYLAVLGKKLVSVTEKNDSQEQNVSQECLDGGEHISSSSKKGSS